MRRTYVTRMLTSSSIALALTVLSAGISQPTYANTPPAETAPEELDRVLPIGTEIRIDSITWVTREPVAMLKEDELRAVLLEAAENERLKKRVKQLEAASVGQRKTITVLGVGIGLGITATAAVWALSTRK